ncbi:MAG: hypothetical protein M1816_007399 [Peltula sp. TS41687]|nr:MAG: hypothetical protein M1816_007399 [Peltula sp. TS41687]
MSPDGLSPSPPTKPTSPDRPQQSPPGSAGVPFTRERTAASMTADDGKPSDPPGQGPLCSATVESRSVDPTSPLCLCLPDQKIPRPRNAFMLYRQHFQASLVAQNPGLPNPEISKIIGRQWKLEPQEVRDSWDALAEEEKARHLQQYPNYKYQPRRKGKGPAALDSAALNGSGVAEWCGKCGRRSITSPTTSRTPLKPRTAPPMLPPLAAATGPTVPYSREGYRIHPLTNTPMTAPPDFRRRPSGPGIEMLQIGQSLKDDVMSPLTPSNKRRRVSPQGWSHLLSQVSRRPSTQGRMDSPARPTPMRRSPGSTTTLPPFQMRARSIEAMVMTIPYLNKIKVLAKISPPLAAPGPTSPTYQVKGALVAIEGEDSESINQVTRWLAEELSRDEEMSIRVFNVNPNDSDMPMDDGPEPSKARDGGSGFLTYLESIAGWHKRSPELVRFITTAPTHNGTQSGTAPSPSTMTPGKRRTPVALIPAYMLTRSNHAAIMIPINDAYAPVDHWQWAATLWRGIVGPDLTIWIKQCGKEEMNQLGIVEVREDARTLVVRKEAGKGIEPRAQRRLVFEVGEYVRTISKADGEDRVQL